MASLHSTGLGLTHKCIKCRSFEGLKLIVPFAGQGIVFFSEPPPKKKLVTYAHMTLEHVVPVKVESWLASATNC